MAKLIANVYVDEFGWFGPSHESCEPPPEVAARITNPACWDEPPAGTPLTAEELAEAAHRTAVATALDHEPGEPPTSGPDALTEAEVVGTKHLDDVPLEREALLAFADDHNLDVNRKLGPVNLKAAIAKALGAE